MIILASKSPRRKELLSMITDDFVIKTANVDETLPHGIKPSEAVLLLSKIKAQPFKNNDNLVIGADTVVCIDDKILGKPYNSDEAHEMLSLLSGREHSVFTGVTLMLGEKCESFCVETKVKFYALSDEEICNYIQSGECFDKAGAYAIQGKGALFIEKICGDYCNVVGLPVSKLNKIINTF